MDSNALDFIGTVITVALMVLVVNTLITFMDVPRVAKVTLAGMFGVWIGLAAAAAGTGWLTISRPVPVVGLFVLVPLLAAALATAWPAAREAMLSIPMPVMVALNIVRVFAVLFLMLAAEQRLTGPFPHSAAWATSSRASSLCQCCGSCRTGARATPHQSRPGICLAQQISCWQSPLALRRRRARPCSSSLGPARKRCSMRPGRSFRRYWSRSG